MFGIGLLKGLFTTLKNLFTTSKKFTLVLLKTFLILIGSSFSKIPYRMG